MTANDPRGIVGLDPTSGPLERRDDRSLAERPANLDGAVIGLVANGLGQGEDFLAALYDELNNFSAPNGAVRVLKESVSVAPEPADWARLTSEVSVAITGFGG